MIFPNKTQKKIDFSQITDDKNRLCSNLDLIHKAYRYSNNPIAFFSNAGLTVSVNMAFEELLGMKFSQLQNKTWFELLGLKPGDIDFNLLTEVISGIKDNCKLETSIQHRCNGPFKANVYAYGLKNQSDKVEFLTIELTKSPQPKIDKQDTYMSHKEIHEMTDHRREKKLIVPILSNFSHEMRTSLNGIVGFSSIIADSDLSDSKIVCHMDMIKSCTNDLLNIAENIIEFMQIETGVAKITPSLVNLNNLLIDIYSLIQSMENTEKSELYLAPGLDNNTCNVLLDEPRLRKILSTMFYKATKTVENESVILGYESLQHSMLFFIFINEKKTPEVSYYSIVKRLAEVSAKTENYPDQADFDIQIARVLTEFMGGKFLYDSDPDKGTVYFVELPVISKN